MVVDKFRRPINIGDFVAVAMLDGRSPDLRIAVVNGLVEPERAGYGSLKISWIGMSGWGTGRTALLKRTTITNGEAMVIPFPPNPPGPHLDLLLEEQRKILNNA